MEWNRKPVFGVGINDIPEYTKGTKVYLVWKSMLARCYSPYTRRTNPAYEGCSVCEEWLTLSNFRKWFEENYREGCQLDKDILIPGNKEYSPSACCFVPQEINKLFKGHSRKFGITTGVRKQNRKYIAQFREGGITHKASFDTLSEAEEFYRNHKRSRLIDIAERYFKADKLSKETYKAIKDYAVCL